MSEFFYWLECIDQVDQGWNSWLGGGGYTQYPIIRNGLIRNNAEFLGKFKKRALGRSN